MWINKFITFFLLITMIKSASAVVISQVMYDPLDESSGEFVELYNNDSFEIDASNWCIKTEASDQDAALPSGIVLHPFGYFLVTDAGFNSNDSAHFPASDHEENINLYNSDSGVAVVDSNGTVIDAIGWGDAAGIENGLFEGEPAVGTEEGQVLLRVRDSGNNLDDFIATNPVFARENDSLTLIVNVGNLQGSGDTGSGDVSIAEINVTDEDESMDGNQIMPSPGKIKKVKVNVVTIGAEDVYAELNGVNKSLRKYSGVYKGSLNMSYDMDPGVYSIDVTAENGSDSITHSIDFEFLPLLAMDIDSSRLSFLNLTPGTMNLLENKPRIKNIGNIPLDLKISGTEIKSDFNSIGISNIRYSFDSFSTNKTLTPEQERINLSLIYSKELSLGLFVPGSAQEGTYAGSLKIIAVES